LLSRYLDDRAIGSIVASSSLLSGVAIPVILLIQPEAREIGLVHGSALVTTGMSSVREPRSAGARPSFFPGPS
jgi:hypothetical protein